MTPGGLAFSSVPSVPSLFLLRVRSRFRKKRHFYTLARPGNGPGGFMMHAHARGTVLHVVSPCRKPLLCRFAVDILRDRSNRSM